MYCTFSFAQFSHRAFQPTKIECNENEFTCDDGSCIDKELLCNGIRDCPDDEDEDQINCPLTEPSSLWTTTTEPFIEEPNTQVPTIPPTEYPLHNTEYPEYPELSTTEPTEDCKLFIWPRQKEKKAKTGQTHKHIGQHAKL